MHHNLEVGSQHEQDGVQFKIAYWVFFSVS